MALTFAHALTGLFWLALLALLVGLARRAALWRRGRPAALSWLGWPGWLGWLGWLGLLAIPKRYFVDLHHVVAREPFIARAHIATAGGAVAALALIAVNYGLLLYEAWLDRAILLFAALMLGGVLAVWWRRRHAPARLSRGAWDRLPYSLMLFAVSLAAAVMLPAQPAAGAVALVVLLALLAGVAELALGIGVGGPMKHAVAGLLHLAFHPRPQRFAGQRSTDLQPLDLTKNEYGIGKPADFAWNRLLSFDACVQCGKCEAACPAFAAGQPLNPKKLIQDLVVGMAGGSDQGYAGSPYPDRPVGRHHGRPDQAIVPALIEAETLWSCTTCRACVQECPMLIEHVDAIVGMRRHLTLTEGAVPGKGGEALDNLRETDTVGGYATAVRYHWAIDLDVPTLAPGQQVEWLLIAGEGAFDMRYQRALRALVQVLKHAGVSFAVLGEQERDCGDLARRLGDEATFQRLARDNITQLATLRFARIVTPDPHVYHCLKNEYPALDPALSGRFEVWHHSEVMARLMDDGKIRLKASSSPAPALTYHDPCYLARYNGQTDAPRAVLRGIGIPVREMERSRERGRCCGGGGGAPFTDIPGKTRIPDIRIADARSIGADVIAVACPNCTAMLEGVVGPRPTVVELAELVAERLAD